MKIIIIIFTTLAFLGCEKDTTAPSSIPAYVGEYNLTKVIFTCGDEQGLSVEDETNIIDGESDIEDAQTLKFILYDYNSELFADSLKINSETGALSFTINETLGSTLVTVILEDDGLDNDEGNFNSSVPIIFSINIEDIKSGRFRTM